MGNGQVPLDETPEMRALWAEINARKEKAAPAGAEGVGSGDGIAPVPAAGSGDRDIDIVLSTVAKLADGNCATVTDVRLVRGDVETRFVRLTMTVGVSWGSTKETLFGSTTVPGSMHCTGHGTARAHLGEICGTACRAPAVSAGVAERMRKAAVAAFSEWQDRYRISDLPHAAHYYENCGNCSGRGVTSCGNATCRSGKTGCFHCRETGKSVCYSCQGNRSFQVNGQMQYCRLCSGSGRFGTCIPCSGTAAANCMTCNGRGNVRCNTCKGHCTFTHVYRTYIEGLVTRTLSFDNGAPEGFRDSCQALPAATLAKGGGVLRRVEAQSAAAEASAVLHCEVRHAHVSIRIRDVGVTVDAVGTGMAVPLMPAFLDDLIDVGGLTSPSDTVAGKNPSARLSEATEASATKGILRMVGRGNAVDAEAFSRTWKGAISPGFVTLVEGRLRRAYTDAARSSVRRVWTVAAIPVTGFMILANAYHIPLRVFDSLWPRAGWAIPHAALAGFVVAQAVVALPLLSAVWLYAGQRARASLRAGVGRLAMRRPRQGAWPWTGLAAAVAAGWMTVVIRTEAANLGLPFAPPVLRADAPPSAVNATPTRPIAAPLRQIPGRDNPRQQR